MAQEKVRRFDDQEYWGKPLPGFGDPNARLVLVGLAPAAHGGNRTGRMFTGDESGNWLIKALYDAGFANRPESLHHNDGLLLKDCYIVAAVRCAPPLNKPSRIEFDRCRPFLLEELSLLPNARVVVGLGKIGFDHAIKAFRAMGKIPPGTMPKFGHGVVWKSGGLTFIATYHPSQQNTFTGKLTRGMLAGVFAQVKKKLQQS